MDSFQEIGPGDSRYPEKQKDIKKTVDRMMALQKKKQVYWENQFGGDLEEATMEAVLKGGGNCVGSTRSYRRNYDKAFGGK